MNVLYVFVDIKIDLMHLVDTVKLNFPKGNKLCMVSTIQFATSLQVYPLIGIVSLTNFSGSKEAFSGKLHSGYTTGQALVTWRNFGVHIAQDIRRRRAHVPYIPYNPLSSILAYVVI